MGLRWSFDDIMPATYEVGDFIWAYYEVRVVPHFLRARTTFQVPPCIPCSSPFNAINNLPFRRSLVPQGEGWFEAEIEEVEGDDLYTVFYHEYDDSVPGQHIGDIRPVRS